MLDLPLLGARIGENQPRTRWADAVLEWLDFQAACVPGMVGRRFSREAGGGAIGTCIFAERARSKDGPVPERSTSTISGPVAIPDRVSREWQRGDHGRLTAFLYA